MRLIECNDLVKIYLEIDEDAKENIGDGVEGGEESAMN
jgi:hypothetical protein